VTAVALTQHTARFRPARALRLEIKHNPGVWVLPLLAAVFYFNAFRTAAGYPPTWTLRAAVITGPNLIFFTVIAAGISAWVATREGRRKTGDLLATTARAAWPRQLTVLAATVFWMVLAYLAGVAVIYGMTAFQATWGGPPWWPVAVGAVGVAAACAVGFAGGTLFPGRFTAPFVAVAVFAAWFIGVNAGNSVRNVPDVSSARGASALLVPSNGGRPQDVAVGVFYHAAPDVSIAQVMFMGGVLLAMVGLLALLPAARVRGTRRLSFAARRPWLTVVAAVAIAAGAAASATAFSLAGTARLSATTGWGIPALHDPADDQPIPYTPDCTGNSTTGNSTTGNSTTGNSTTGNSTTGNSTTGRPPFTVCIHPAFAPYLGALAAALQPAAAEVAGLPGVPVRAAMTTGETAPALAGTTSVYQYSPELEGVGDESAWVTPATARGAAWEQGIQQDFITWFVSGPSDQEAPGPTPAQEAVAIALLAKLGAPVPPGYPQFSQPDSQSGSSGESTGPDGSATQPTATAAQVNAAAASFESLSSSARHTWLAANIAALRTGAVTLAMIP
jgi:hypothetical protein